MDTQILTLICQHFGVTEAQVEKMRADPETGDITLLINYGIGGTKKLHFTPPKPAPKPEEAALDFDATSGALELAKREGVDLSKLYQGRRLTRRDVTKYLKERDENEL